MSMPRFLVILYCGGLYGDDVHCSIRASAEHVELKKWHVVVREYDMDWRLL